MPHSVCMCMASHSINEIKDERNMVVNCHVRRPMSMKKVNVHVCHYVIAISPCMKNNISGQDDNITVMKPVLDIYFMT